MQAPDGTEVMVPGEDSHNIGPPWTPTVWTKGPDGCIADAQSLLWHDRVELDGVTISQPGNAMSGQQAAPANEWEQSINPAQPPEGQGRATQWRNTVNTMRATAPLAGTTKPLSWGGDIGTPNPDA